MNKAVGAGRWLALAATPTFAVMALLTASSSGQDIMFCSPAHPSPLSGMTPMYLLMSLFHAPPWLKILRPSAFRRP